MPLNLEEIRSPVLLLNEEICRSNIRGMARKAQRHGLALKPHFKTHQSADIGKWFRDEGIHSITVSSIDMAEYFAGAGWDDITIAFPCNIREIDRIHTLSQKVRLSLLISDTEVIEILKNNSDGRVNVYIEIDTGSNRTGIPADDLSSIRQLAQAIQPAKNLIFKGFYSHPGHSYSARSKDEILSIHRDVSQKMAFLKKELGDEFGDIAVCVGDTPCCSVADSFDSIDEISPGNFVFYDLMQTEIGACTPGEIAVCLAAPVVTVYHERNELVVHGGAVHLSKDYIVKEGNQKVFGYPVPLDNNGWSDKPNPAIYLKSLSQEHGVISATPQYIQQVSPGDLIGILPIHSCLTANLMGKYKTLDGKILEHFRSKL